MVRILGDHWFTIIFCTLFLMSFILVLSALPDFPETDTETESEEEDEEVEKSAEVSEVTEVTEITEVTEKLDNELNIT